MTELLDDAIGELTDPRERLLVLAGHIRAITQVGDIIDDIADGADAMGPRDVLQAISDRMGSLLHDCMREQDRLAIQLAPGRSTAAH